MMELLLLNIVLGLLKAGAEGLAIGAGIGLMLRKVQKSKKG
jgi:hypothetical protein